MEIKVSTETGRVPVTVLHVDCSIESGAYEGSQTIPEELLKGEARHVLIDLWRAPYSSANLRALKTIFNRLRGFSADMPNEEMRKRINARNSKSPHLKLLNPSKASILALDNSSFSIFIESFSDLRTAVAPF